MRPLRRLPKRNLRRLPRRLAVSELSARGWPRACTEDAVEVVVPPPFRLEVYWLRIDDDEGPAFSLFHRTDEILRVDCLRDRPHIHYALAETRYLDAVDKRVYMAPGPVEDLIDRAVYGLGHNVAYCTGRHRDRAVRNAPVDQTALRTVAGEVGDHLRSLVAARRT